MAKVPFSLALGLALVVSACGGGSDTQKPARLHVSSTTDGSVLSFPVTVSGDVAPTASISSPGSPANLAVDATGRLYVANIDANRVSVFADGATGVPLLWPPSRARRPGSPRRSG
jgi:DNA-binding beta-propeller fold protein YncE